MSLAFSMSRRPLATLLCSVRPQIRTYAAVPEKRKPENYTVETGNIYKKGTAPASPSTAPAPPSSFATPAKPRRDAAAYQTPIDAPRSHGPLYDKFEPQLLPRPIGMLDPPLRGQNTGLDTRTKAQRTADASNYEKHLQRRQELITEFQRPYFRDQRNLRHHGGKSFLAPPRLFKAELALYFPNLHGETLIKPGRGSDASAINRDTTPVLEGRTTIVTVFSSMWAESQCESFVAEKANPELHEVLSRYAETERFLPGFPAPQIVRINMERNPVRAWIVRFFKWSLRRYFKEPDWGKYFLVTKGVTGAIREATGILNSKAGYVYLVDEQCRIRWAGSGRANEDEMESLAKGMRRLLSDAETKLKTEQNPAPAQVA